MQRFGRGEADYTTTVETECDRRHLLQSSGRTPTTRTIDPRPTAAGRLARDGWRAAGITGIANLYPHGPPEWAPVARLSIPPRHAQMATRKPSFRDELCEYNDRLDTALRSRYGMTFRTFKVVKALTQLAGVGATIYAMTLGAPPLAALTMAMIMVSGPEVLEILIEGQGE